MDTIEENKNIDTIIEEKKPMIKDMEIDEINEYI